MIDSLPWRDRESPNSYLAKKEILPPTIRHAFGAYCLYFVDPEQRVGKWQPTSEMGVWIG